MMVDNVEIDNQMPTRPRRRTELRCRCSTVEAAMASAAPVMKDSVKTLHMMLAIDQQFNRR